MKILNFIKNNLLSNYFIIDAYDCFGNKVNHKIARNFLEKEITLFVTEPVYEDEMSMEDGMMEEESKKSVLPIVIAIVAAVVVIVIVLIVLLRKKKKKKQEQAELLELEEELKDEE